MPRRILYFINPISGPKKSPTLQPLITSLTTKAGIDFEITATNKEGDYAFLRAKIKEEGITDVVICGGDGTVNALAASLAGESVNIGIIPLGSGNGLANCAKIPASIEKAIDVVLKGKSSPVDAFFINNKFSCMLSGMGLDAHIAYDFSIRKRRGLITYVQETVRNFFKAPAYPFSITVGNETFETEAYFISIANSNQYGNNFTIAPRACLSDGLVDVIIVNKMAKFHLLRAIWKQLRAGELLPAHGLPNRQNDVMYFQTEELKIGNPSLAPLHIDGDPAKTHHEFDIKIIKEAFMLIQP